MTMINLSTSGFYQSAGRAMKSLRAEAERLQQQGSTQNRLQRSSDDPVAAARLRTLDRTQRLAAIDSSNSDRAMNDLKLTDGALSAIVTLTIRAQDLALQAASPSLSADTKQSLSVELEGLHASLLSLANTRNSAGHALFGGETPGQAYEAGLAGVSYAGTATTLAVELGESQQVIPTLTGPEFLSFHHAGAETDLFAVISALATELRAGSSDTSAAANAALEALDTGLNKVSTAQTIIGGRMNWVEMMDDRRTAQNELLADETNSIGDADLSATLVRLQEVMTVLEASQASFVKLASLSLFSMIR